MTISRNNFSLDFRDVCFAWKWGPFWSEMTHFQTCHQPRNFNAKQQQLKLLNKLIRFAFFPMLIQIFYARQKIRLVFGPFLAVTKCEIFINIFLIKVVKFLSFLRQKIKHFFFENVQCLGLYNHQNFVDLLLIISSNLCSE